LSDEIEFDFLKLKERPLQPTTRNNIIKPAHCGPSITKEIVNASVVKIFLVKSIKRFVFYK
jgi:hypothetical protein